MGQVAQSYKDTLISNRVTHSVTVVPSGQTRPLEAILKSRDFRQLNNVHLKPNGDTDKGLKETYWKASLN
jgi:hypothetical protein